VPGLFSCLQIGDEYSFHENLDDQKASKQQEAALSCQYDLFLGWLGQFRGACATASPLMIHFSHPCVPSRLSERDADTLTGLPELKSPLFDRVY